MREFIKSECLPVITQIKKHSSKQVVSTIYTLGKDFFATATFHGSETFLFRQSKKVSSILWTVSVFFAFLQKRRPNR